MAIAAELDDEVTILSSSPQPPNWLGLWISLPLDTDDLDGVPTDVAGVFHWAPVGSRGLASRMQLISQWLSDTNPSVVVVDVSVEVSTLVRLHGIPIVVIAQPGNRVDAAHTLGYRIANAVIGCWPASVSPLAADVATLDRIHSVGGISRVSTGADERERNHQIAVINGTGGRGESALMQVADEARQQLADFRWVVLENKPLDEVAATLRSSAFVFAHCGQNAVAEVAATHTRAVLVPEARPFDEQHYLGRALQNAALPARVVNLGEIIRWRAVIEDLSRSNPAEWRAWVDGHAAQRAAKVIEQIASTARLPSAGVSA
jgi:hypothetical protein